jgi:hypothetical protein
MGRHVHDAGHPFIARSLWGVAHVAFLDLRLEEALELQGEAVEIAAQADSWPHPERAGSLLLLATIQRALGNYTAEEVAILDARGQMVELFGPEHPRTLLCNLQLGALRAAQGDGVAARQLLDPLIELLDTPGPLPRDQLAGAHRVLARLAREEGRFEAAYRHLEDGLGLLSEIGVEPIALVPFQLETGRLMLDWDRPEDAVTLLELARESLHAADPEQGRLRVARALLAEAAVRRDHDGGAEQQLLRAIETLAERLPGDHPALSRARTALAQLR